MPFMRRINGKEPKKVSLSLFILERMLKQVVKLGVLSYLLAWLLSRTSDAALVNLPVAAALVVLVRLLSQRLVLDTRAMGSSSRSSRRIDRYMGPTMYYREKFRVLGSEGGTGHNDREAWKKCVNAPIVAGAWESFCGSILQEWIYDTWYSLLTPDREFPAAIRRLLNEIFAEIAQRCKRIDLRNVLIRDMCDLFMEHLELYRATKEAVGILKKGDLRPSSIDRAFQQEMRTEGTLHVAFCSRDGHYRVIRRICEGVLSVVMSKDDLARPYARSITRELLATCVIRPILMWFSPYTFNKLILSAFPDDPNPEAAKLREQKRQRVKRERQNGNFLFEQRVRKSAVLEERAVKRAMDRGPVIKNSPSTSNNGTALTSVVPPREQSIKQQSPKKQRDALDGSSVDGSAMLNEDNRPFTSLRRRRSKSMDDMSALVMENNVGARKVGFYGESDKPDMELQSAASEPTPTRRPVLHQTSLPANWMGSVAYDSIERPSNVEEQTPSSGNQVGMDTTQFSGSLEVHIGFKGRPRARVVVHEVMYDTTGRRYVAFKIRVADDTGEWTVTRRYRNFEALHKMLRDNPVYQCLRLKLPPKRFLLHSQNTEFVEERRVSLDRYLQMLLSEKTLAYDENVAAFLCDQDSELYRHDMEVSLIRTITDNVDAAKYKVKRAVRPQARTQLDKQPSGIEEGSTISTSSPAHRQMDPPERVLFKVSGSSVGMSSPFAPKYQDPQGGVRTVESILHHRGTPSQVSYHASSMSNFDMGTDHVSLASSSWHEGPSMCSSRADSPGRSMRGSDVKSVSLSDARSVGGSSDTPLKAVSHREDVGREAFAWNSLPVMESEDPWPDWETAFEDYSGISGPLYEVVDAVFALPAQRFFRRRVLQVVRQLLSLLAGDSIDLYLLDKIKSFRSEHTIARMIHSLRSTLWPGGNWFTTVPPYSTIRAEQQAANPGVRKPMQRDRYLEPVWTPPDAGDIAERVYHQLLEQAPPPLVTIVGKNCYANGMQDVYDMLQLPTFMTQMGYGVLEIVLVALFPELRDFFARIHREAVHMKDT